ncbi:MAG: site-2 protease family protein [Aquificaceae bacterium]|nr:site-2 protease family protein [Aquificaceae bacterium]MDW8237033.1 site-2 protease family protein [Aquificaceae bacterium]
MDPQEAIVSLTAIMVAVILHEYAHAWMADKMGDRTARELGRLTINPLPHVDPIGTVVLPGALMLLGSPILFGWAKPVPIDPSRFHSLRKGMFLVSIAGISMNMILAVAFALVYRFLTGLNGSENPILLPLTILAIKSVIVNLFLAFLNAIPIPPLDGSRALMSFFSVRYWEAFYKFELYGFVILTLLIFSGIVGGLLYAPVVYLSTLLLGS